MQNSFFQAICRVGIFMICAQAITHFRPQEAYEKYLKLLVSLMVLIQLFLPVGSFLLGGGRQEAAGLLEEFQQELDRGMKEAEESAAAMDDILRQMTLEEVRKSLEENPETGNTESEREGEGEEEDTESADRENGEPENETEKEDGNVIKIEVEPVDPVSIPE